MNGGSNYIMWGMLALLILMFWLMSRSSRKRQEQMRQQAERALVPGNWVMTRAGFYGRVVDVDGQVVMLETVDGVETMWDKMSIVGEKEPPFADAIESDSPASSSSEVDSKTDENEKDNPSESEGN